ncbi:hypothetical protein HZS_862 [Henneguya salminicola]|nr:hypothetical protein HZS_862 [Henneguya salminicola]
MPPKKDAKKTPKDKKKVDKTKMVMKKVAGGGGSKAKKKKWSKGKTRDKLENQVFLDQLTYDKAAKEIAKMVLVTPAIVSEKYKLKVSIARNLLKQMAEKNITKIVQKSNSSLICTRILKEQPVLS